ncbi:MAG: hydantoinase/oxoprolinase family protein [Halieaceae bacterium]|jgi:acetone carboxylase, beta subunit|nr:hydantoinase/oxoprolinase family protein [Halieaceae bacterium]
MRRYLAACDAGGTMTDVILVDEEGNSVVGKAPTTPHDESIGYMESMIEAMDYMGIPKEQQGTFGKQLETSIYTGTSMLNCVINMSGYKTGLITTRGFEDITAQGRGKQTFIGLQWSEITHMQYRKHRTPLVPRKLTRGVTERIDMFGNIAIPMYEHDVEQAARELIVDEQCESIAIVFLQSYINDQHEQRAGEIVRRVMTEASRDIPIELSCLVAPTAREISRANSTIVQAYASDPARKQLFRIEDELKKMGYQSSLKTVLGYGGVTNIRYPRLFEAAMSGPIGGLMGARYLGSVIGENNIVCSDVGGTSFDAGVISSGVLPIDREPGFQNMYVNAPMLGITSIGAGTGTYIRVDPATNRIKLGPDSAGGTPGPTFMETGNTTPTINDCNLLLGILDENNYLGGKVKVNKEVSYRLFKQKVADPLKMDVYDAAEVCLELLNVMMREHLTQNLMIGYDLRDYTLLGYGGGGPLHLLPYAGDNPYKAVCTVPWAGGFSAWGGACMDYAHRRHKSITAMIAPQMSTKEKLASVAPVVEIWSTLRSELFKELVDEGFAPEQIELQPVAYVRYYGQLEDLEVSSPVERLDSQEDLDTLLAAFDDLYTKLFTLAAKPDHGTYSITEVAVVAKVATVKPKLIEQPLAAKEPPASACQGTRQLYRNGAWQDADIFKMENLLPGNEMDGLAVIQASNTTLFVPPEWHVKIDKYNIYWMTRKGEA